MNVVTKLRNAKYVFVHLHSVFDCPSLSQSATCHTLLLLVVEEIDVAIFPQC